jgi:phosphatidylinositol alpha-mannosyltransferase
MAAGRAVVCADIPGYRSVVIPDHNGVVHTPGDVGALATALSALVDDEDRRARLSENGRARALEFAWPTVTQKIESVYQTVVGVSATTLERPPSVARSAA